MSPAYLVDDVVGARSKLPSTSSPRNSCAVAV